MSKNHCGDPEACQKEPYSEDACDCSCDRCGPWADERDEREQQVPAGTSIEASLLVSRLIADACQRDRFIGRLQERLSQMTWRALNAENIVRSMRGNGDDARKGRSAVIRKAVKGAKAAERARILGIVLELTGKDLSKETEP
jgi:hypothetical protein